MRANMLREIVRSPSRSFFLATALFVALVFASIGAVAFSNDTKSSRGGAMEEGSRFVAIWNRYYVDGGDVLRIPPPWAFNNPIRDHVTLYVIEGGEAESLADGVRPAHVYLEAPLTFETVDVRRPEPPEGKPHETPEGWNPPIDEYDSLDVAYVLDKQAVPESDRLWIGAFRNAANEVYGELVHPVAIDGILHSAQHVLVAMTGIAFALLLFASARWWMAYRRMPARPDAAGAESLLRVAYSANAYLLVLRRLTVLNGVLLFFVGIFGLTAANYYMESLYRWVPFPEWNDIIMVLLWILFIILMVVWVVHYRLVAREQRRVLADTARPPLDL